MNPLKACIAIAALAASAEAAALRCDHKLITEGDRGVEVRRYCGEPIAVSKRYTQGTLVTRHGRYLLRGAFPTEVLVEEWTYNFGPRRLMRIIRLENGVVTDIEALGYGFREKEKNEDAERGSR